MPIDANTRIKRLRMQSWRRGTKEMDLILGPYSDRMLEVLSQAQLDAYETMLTENDIDLYLWYSGAAQAPKTIADVLHSVQRFNAGQ